MLCIFRLSCRRHRPRATRVSNCRSRRIHTARRSASIALFVSPLGSASECDLMPQQVPTIDVDVYGLGLYSTRNGSDLTQLLPSRHTTKGNLLQEPAPGCVGCTGTFFFAGSSKDNRNLAAVQKAPSLVAQLRVHAASNAAQCCVWRHITSFATMHLAWRFVTQAQALSS